MAFGDYLKELRQGKGLSQKELSSLTEGQVSNAEISRLEAGIRKKPSPAVLKILAPHLGVPVESLLTEAGYMDGLPLGFVGGEGGDKADVQMQARLQSLLDEGIAVKRVNQKLEADNQKLSQQISELQNQNRQLEEKCGDFWKRSQSVMKGSSGLEEEVRLLRSQLEDVKEENRRIKEAAGAAEAQRVELQEALDCLTREKTDLLAQEEALRQELAQSAGQGATNQAEAQAKQEQIRGLEEQLAALKMQLADVAAKDRDVAGEQEKRKALEGEMRKLKEENFEMLAKNSELARERTTIKEKFGELEKTLKRKEEELEAVLVAAADSQGKEETLCRERDSWQAKAAEKEAVAKKLESSLEQIRQDLASLQRESRAAVDTLQVINNAKVEGFNLGQLFVAMAGSATADDLILLGSLMQTLQKEGIRPSDKKMLLDFVKRLVK